MSDGTKDSVTDRDSASLRILGWFFLVLGGLVLVGTCWTLDNYRATTVSLLSGSVLVAVGVATIYVAKRLARRPKPSTLGTRRESSD